MDQITNPHDRMFRETWSNREIAIDGLNHYLPGPVLKLIDLNTLEICKDSFIEEELRDYYSDLLYKVGIDGKDGYVHVLFEHKSYPEKLTPLQVLEYEIRIWRLYLKQRPKKKPLTLPVVIPVVLYHGKREWNFEDTFSALFEQTGSTISNYIPNFKYVLIDLGKYSDDAIKGTVMSRVTMLLFKYVFDPDYVKKLPGIFSLLKELSESESGLEYIEKFLRYLVSTAENLSPDELKTIIKQSSIKDKGGLIMTLAEQWENQGYQRGIQQGIQQGGIQMLHEMIDVVLALKFGSSSAKIMERVQGIRDFEKLKIIKDLVKTTDNLSDVEKLLQ